MCQLTSHSQQSCCSFRCSVRHIWSLHMSDLTILFIVSRSNPRGSQADCFLNNGCGDKRMPSCQVETREISVLNILRWIINAREGCASLYDWIEGLWQEPGNTRPQFWIDPPPPSSRGRVKKLNAHCGSMQAKDQELGRNDCPLFQRSSFGCFHSSEWNAKGRLVTYAS